MLVYVDDFGFGDLGSYGHPIIKTPNINSLASDGLRFTSNYSPSALCSPSRAVLIAPVFNGEELQQRSLFWALHAASDLGYAVRSGSWKLMLDTQGEPRELYNLAEDPLELFSIIDQHPAELEMLVDEFASHRESIASDRLRPNTDQGYEK